MLCQAPGTGLWFLKATVRSGLQTALSCITVPKEKHPGRPAGAKFGADYDPQGTEAKVAIGSPKEAGIFLLSAQFLIAALSPHPQPSVCVCVCVELGGAGIRE